MKCKIPCSIVRDLLPNYVDKLTEEGTNIIIEEHLTDCPDCKMMYDDMNGELEVNKVNTDCLHENKARDFLNKAKLGYVMKIIFKVLRILTIILYLILNVGVIFYVFSLKKYPAITDKNVVQGILVISAITIIIPGILIATLFIRKDHIILKIYKCLIQLLLLAALPYVLVIGMFMAMVIPSHTTNPDNYGIRDNYADHLLEKQNFTILPKKLPDEITDVDYLYDYKAIMDDEYLTLEITYTYNNITDYQKAKAEMQTYEPVNHQVDEDEFHMIFTSGESISDKHYACFGYNDDKHRVTYRILYNDDVISKR